MLTLFLLFFNLCPFSRHWGFPSHTPLPPRCPPLQSFNMDFQYGLYPRRCLKHNTSSQYSSCHRYGCHHFPDPGHLFRRSDLLLIGWLLFTSCISCPSKFYYFLLVKFTIIFQNHLWVFLFLPFMLSHSSSTRGELLRSKSIQEADSLPGQMPTLLRCLRQINITWKFAMDEVPYQILDSNFNRMDAVYSTSWSCEVM